MRSCTRRKCWRKGFSRVARKFGAKFQASSELSLGSLPVLLCSFSRSNSGDDDGGVIAAASSSWLAALVLVKLAVAVVGVVDTQYFTKAFLKGLMRRCLL